MLKKIKIQIVLLLVLFFIGISVYTVTAGTFSPSSAPGSTMKTLEDIYCLIIDCTPATYGLDSGGAVGSTMNTLQEIYDELSSLTIIDFSLQKNLIWDDAKGVASSTENSLAYAYANAVDQNKEEGEWTAYTDSSLGTETIASGEVYKDERTGLYWSNCYSASQDNTCDTITNVLTMDGVVDSETGLDAEGGDAINFCKNLSLDPNGDGDKTDWYLPSQKELLQAYINGAGNNIPLPGYGFWSSTLYHNSTSNIRAIQLDNGRVVSDGFNTRNNYARCVRR